jgi:hypothetical protein
LTALMIGSVPDDAKSRTVLEITYPTKTL